ncbi:hypothetical protein [Actinomadura roseirufa]|uniref:hypothetical protein n=1 Tax=Actinomadura roseirufa TaxID=2094049 RepID=UPI0010418C2F|nr:hypothetical protein [Actinomadura roseirufa]
MATSADRGDGFAGGHRDAGSGPASPVLNDGPPAALYNRTEYGARPGRFGPGGAGPRRGRRAGAGEGRR